MSAVMRRLLSRSHFSRADLMGVSDGKSVNMFLLLVPSPLLVPISVSVPVYVSYAPLIVSPKKAMSLVCVLALSKVEIVCPPATTEARDDGGRRDSVFPAD